MICNVIVRLRAICGLAGRLVQIEFSLVVVPAIGVNPDQPQGVGATLVTHPVTHRQDNLVSGGDGAEAPQYLQRCANDLLDIITFRLVLRWIDVAEQRHPAAASFIGRKCIDRDR